MRIATGGNVGIGTTSQHKLDVSGDVRATAHSCLTGNTSSATKLQTARNIAELVLTVQLI